MVLPDHTSQHAASAVNVILHLAQQDLKSPDLVMKQPRPLILLPVKRQTVLFQIPAQRVLDIGNMDLEYEWYVRGVSGKIPLNKHDIVGEEAIDRFLHGTLQDLT